MVCPWSFTSKFRSRSHAAYFQSGGSSSEEAFGFAPHIVKTIGIREYQLLWGAYNRGKLEEGRSWMQVEWELEAKPAHLYCYKAAVSHSYITDPHLMLVGLEDTRSVPTAPVVSLDMRMSTPIPIPAWLLSVKADEFLTAHSQGWKIHWQPGVTGKAILDPLEHHHLHHSWLTHFKKQNQGETRYA